MILSEQKLRRIVRTALAENMLYEAKMPKWARKRDAQRQIQLALIDKFGIAEKPDEINAALGVRNGKPDGRIGKTTMAAFTAVTGDSNFDEFESLEDVLDEIETAEKPEKTPMGTELGPSKEEIEKYEADLAEYETAAEEHQEQQDAKAIELTVDIIRNAWTTLHKAGRARREKKASLYSAQAKKFVSAINASEMGDSNEARARAAMMQLSSLNKNAGVGWRTSNEQNKMLVNMLRKISEDDADMPYLEDGYVPEWSDTGYINDRPDQVTFFHLNQAIGNKTLGKAGNIKRFAMKTLDSAKDLRSLETFISSLDYHTRATPDNSKVEALRVSLLQKAQTTVVEKLEEWLAENPKPEEPTPPKGYKKEGEEGAEGAEGAEDTGKESGAEEQGPTSDS